MQINSDGVPSTSNATFWVASALTIDATKSAWDTSPADKRIIRISTSQQIQSLPTWTLSAGASDSTYGTVPFPTWKLTEASAGTINTAGLFTASGAFKESKLTGKVGSLGSNALTLSAQEVTVS